MLYVYVENKEIINLFTLTVHEIFIHLNLVLCLNKEAEKIFYHDKINEKQIFITCILIRNKYSLDKY